MAGGDTGAVSAAGGGTGGRIFDRMRDAVDAYTNLDTHSYRDPYSHSHTADYDRTLTSCNPGVYSDLYTATYDCDPNSPSTDTYSNSHVNTYTHTYGHAYA